MVFWCFETVQDVMRSVWDKKGKKSSTHTHIKRLLYIHSLIYLYEYKKKREETSITYGIYLFIYLFIDRARCIDI